MRVYRALWGRFVTLAVLSALSGCSSSSDSGSAGAKTPVSNPPANVDVELCASITGDFSTIATACQTCCTKGGFSESTSYDAKCVCGNEPEDDTTCVAKDEASCPTCCTGLGYNGYSFFGGSGSSTCSCMGKSDSKICSSAASNEGAGCPGCCLNNGYLGSGYTNLGTPECECF